MGVRVKDEGQFKEIYVKALDSLPVGTIVDYDGQASDIPTGWETYGTNQIKKTSETRPLASHTVNAYSESESNAYSCDYVNNTFGETVLYNNTTGSNVQTISLSDSSANYKYIEIFYRSTDNVYSSVKVYEPNGKRFDITSHYYLTGTMYAKTSCYQFSTNQINRITFGSWSVSSASSTGEASDIFITRVVGYKTGLFPTQQSTRSVNTYSGDIEEKKDIVIDDSEEEKPIDDGNDENNK